MKFWGWLFFLLILIGGGLWELSCLPQDVFIRWNAYEITTKTPFLFLGVLLLLLLWSLFLGGWRWVRSFPEKCTLWWRRHYQTTRQQLTLDILCALEEEDFQKVDKCLQKSETYFKHEPFLVFLKYSWAKRVGKALPEQEALTLLSTFPGGNFFQQKGQIAKAIARHDAQEAVFLLESLRSQQKGGPWACKELFPLYLEQGKLSEAEGLLKKASWCSPEQAKKERARLLYLQALEMPHDLLQRESLLRKAHFLDPSFGPVAVHLAQILGNQKKEKQAREILETAWRHTPSGDIAVAYSALSPGETPTQRFQHLQKLTQTNAHHALSYWIIGRAALEAQLWGAAREALTHLAVKKPQLAYPLLAQLEQRQHGDWEAACRWLEKGYGSDDGAPGESRTPTSAKITDFESAASTNSATGALSL